MAQQDGNHLMLGGSLRRLGPGKKGHAQQGCDGRTVIP